LLTAGEPARKVRRNGEGSRATEVEHPGLGPTYSHNPSYRTWRLEGTPYVLLDRVGDAVETIWIVDAWSALRGSGPELP